MVTFEEFLRSGHLGPVILGMTPVEVMTALGEPQSTSKKSNPLLLKYGSAQLSFWRRSNHRTQSLREIAIIYQPTFEPLPDTLAFPDWNPASPPTESEFKAYLNEIDYLPVHRVEGPSEGEIAFLSGVTARFTDEMLDSIRLRQQANKEATPSTLSNEREPTTSQIFNMLDEADIAMRSGAYRAALLLAWAGLEAALRRTALNAGRQGKIGVQPSILIRELFAAGKLTPGEHTSVEELRQLRTALAHGLAPTTFDVANISKISDLSKRLLNATENSAT